MAGTDPRDSDGGEGQGAEDQGVRSAERSDQEARGAHPHRVQDPGHGGPLLEVLRLRRRAQASH